MFKDSAKTILCYGDSNTWGNVPRSDERYPRSVRWPGALQNLLGNDYEVISEGLCGRTFVASNPEQLHRTGITHLQSIVESADPIDFLIIMLGTNDVKNTYNLSAEEIAEHLEQTIKLVRETEDIQQPQILVVCPPPVIMPSDGQLDSRMGRGIEMFKQLPPLYKKVAEKNGCDFIDAGDHISSSTIDGYHMDAGAHLKLAKVLNDFIISKFK